MRYLLIFIIFLLACSVGPDYKKPAFETPKAFYSKLAKEIQVDNSDDFIWWQYFNDPILQRIIEESLTNNQDILIAVERVNEARALYGEAFSAYFPDAKINASYLEGLFGTARNPFFVDRPRDYRVNSAGVTANWEIDIFGRVRRLNESKSALKELSDNSLIDVILTVQAELTKAYINLRALQAEEKVVKENAKAQHEVLKIVQNMYNSGASTAFDLERARSLYFQTKSEIPKIQATREATLNQIAVLLGKTVGELPSDIIIPYKIPWYLGPVKITNPEKAIKLRPDVVMAEKELISANAVIGQEIAEFFPKLTLVGEIGLEAKNFSSLDNTGADIRSYGPSLSWSILNFNRIQQRVDAADARTKQAMHNYKKTILQAFAEIEGALTRFRTERNRYMFGLKSFQASKKASQIARDQYSVGALPLLDVITAEQSKLELERMLKVMEGNLQISYVELFHVFGRGYAVNPDTKKQAIPNN